MVSKNYQVGEFTEKSDEKSAAAVSGAGQSGNATSENKLQTRALNRRSIQLSHSKSRHMSDNESLGDNAYQEIDMDGKLKEKKPLNLSGLPGTQINTIHTESVQNLELPEAHFDMVAKQAADARPVITPQNVHTNQQAFDMNEIYQFE